MATAQNRYNTVAMLFHWLIAILIVVNIGLAWTLDSFDHHSPEHERLLTVHKSIGVTVLVVAVLRLIWRCCHPPPPLPDTLPAWQRLAARVTHWTLYALLLVMPLTGLIDAGGFSEPVHYFFLFDLPPLIAHNEPLGHCAFAIHKTGAVALYALLLVHAGAALHHHYFRKDDTLRRMLPRAAG